MAQMAVGEERGSGSLWRRWVIANALSEACGLGLTLGLTGILMSRLEALPGVAAVLLSFVVAVADGVIEATLVGLAQWWAMHPWLPRIARRDWWWGTLIGALLAYVLGYLPSTIIGLTQQSGDTSAAPVSEPSQAVTLLLAAGLGLVAGAILSFAQYRVLRGHVERAGRWIPANMLAWAAGMPIVFWAVDLAFRLPELSQRIAVMIVALLVMGAVVGAIHGYALVKMVASLGTGRRTAASVR